MNILVLILNVEIIREINTINISEFSCKNFTRSLFILGENFPKSPCFIGFAGHNALRNSPVHH